MGRAPCCERMGLKKGPWTATEDQILVSYINQNGHGNWRALPKRAGLLRCGKSCRLRWMNYLRPDIKRGNFTLEEEGIIVKLHAELGNKWSEIAARLPGRTDNEIKNVWHTHLKKKINSNFQLMSNTKPQKINKNILDPKINKPLNPNSMGHLSGDTSAVAVAESGDVNVCMVTESLDRLTEMDTRFWSDVFPEADWSGTSDLSFGSSDSRVQSPDLFANWDLDIDGRDYDFWHDMEFTKLF